MTLASVCSASFPVLLAAFSPPLWGSVMSPIMGLVVVEQLLLLPLLSVLESGLLSVLELVLGFGEELVVFSLFLLSVLVVGSLSLKWAVYTPLIQLLVQGEHAGGLYVILAATHLDSHILPDGCFVQRWLRRTFIMAMHERIWVLFIRIYYCLSVFVLIVSSSCRCRMTLF